MTLKTLSVLLTLSLCIPPIAGFAQELSTAPAANRLITLTEAFRLALAKSEVLAAQGEGVAQLKAFERQLKASFHPELSLNTSESVGA